MINKTINKISIKCVSEVEEYAKSLISFNTLKEKFKNIEMPQKSLKDIENKYIKELEIELIGLMPKNSAKRMAKNVIKNVVNETLNNIQSK